MNSHPTDQACLFCKIIAGQIPSHKLYEDDQVYSFLDIGPLSPGHALVIPKGHYLTLDQVPDEVGAAIGRVLPKLSKAIAQATGAASWNILQNNGTPAGQVVGHVHFHIIPRPDPASSARDGDLPGNGLPFGWPAGEVDHEAAAVLAQTIMQQRP